MKYKSLLIICLIVCVLFSISNVAASDANETAIANEDTQQTIEETYEDTMTTNSQEDTLETDAGTFTALQSKINNAEEGSTITLENDYVIDGNFTKSHVDVNKSITINGNNHKIDALNKSGIFYIKSDNVYISNINFLNANNARAVYGNDYYSAKNIEIRNCTFTNNNGDSGCAIYLSNDNVKIFDCTFSHNQDSDNVVVLSGDNGEINNCNFINNYGSPLHFVSGNGILSNCSFSNNSDMFKNTAWEAMRAGGKNFTLKNCIFMNNEFPLDVSGSSVVLNSTFIGNNHKISYTTYAGGLFVYECNEIKISDCYFERNYATSGGAIYLNSYAHNVLINNCNFINNNKNVDGYYIAEGGAIYCQCSNAKIQDCNFSNNIATHGAAIYIDGDNCILTGLRFDNNYAFNNGIIFVEEDNCQISDCIFTGNNADNGGSIYWMGFDGVLSNSQFNKNNAKSDGGVICIDGSQFSSVSVKNTFSMFNNTFRGNTPNIYGGSINLNNNILTVKTSADSKGNITLDIGGKTFFSNIDSGKATFDLNGLSENTYDAKIKYSGDNTYYSTEFNIPIIITAVKNSDSKPSGDSSTPAKKTKANPKLTASSKTFKVKTKTKKYTVTLKTNKNKAMKNIKLYLKVNGKTYTAKTNSKGKATFKITKLKKKGTFKATITYKGNTNYNKVTKTVKIKCR